MALVLVYVLLLPSNHMATDDNEWDSLVWTVVFLLIVWSAGRLCKVFLISPIVGELITGITLGPHVLGVAPISSPSVMKMLLRAGQVGVTLIVMESGLHVNFNKIRRMGWRVWSVGLIGTIVPMVMGLTIFASVLDIPWYPDAFNAAVIITPASVGIAMRVLLSKRKLNTEYGQSIVIAAYEDDLAALLLFIMLKASDTDEDATGQIVGSLAGAIGFIAISCLMAIYIVPTMMHKFLSRYERSPDHSYMLRDDLHMLIVCLFIIGYSLIGHILGSHLLGAFLAGITFSKVIRTSLLWESQWKQIVSWLLRTFFAATVAFSIPIGIMLEMEVFLKGLLVTLVCVSSKIIPTLHLPAPNRWLVGFALVGRGEFSYLIAEHALATGSISEKTYATLMWGLLLSLLISPIMLQYLIRKTEHRINPRTIEEASHVAYKMIIEGHSHIGLIRELSTILELHGLEIQMGHIVCDQEISRDEFIIYPRRPTDIVDDEKLDEVKDGIISAFNDSRLQIHFEKITRVESGRLECRIMGREINKLIEVMGPVLSEYNLALGEVTREPHNDTELATIVINGRVVSEAERRELERVVDQKCEEDEIDVEILFQLHPEEV